MLTFFRHTKRRLSVRVHTSWYGLTERADWWERMERETAGTWSKRYTREATRQIVDAQGDWIFDDASALCQADGGECVF